MRTRFAQRALAVVAFGWTLLGPCQASGIFLQLAPNQGPGDAKAEGYSGWFSVSGELQWGVLNPLNGGQAVPGYFVIHLGPSDGQLQEELLRRLTSPAPADQTVTVHLVKSSEKAVFAYYRLLLEGVSVAEVSFGSSPGEPPRMQTRLDYKKFTVAYHYQDSKKPFLVAGLGAQSGWTQIGGHPPLAPVVAFADFAVQQVQVSGLSGAVTNEPPTLSAIPDQSWPENTVRVVDFRANSPRARASALQVTALASNPLLLPDDQVFVRPLGTNAFQLVMTPVRNTSGTCQVRVRVEDGLDAAEVQFQAEVRAGAKMPVLAPVLQPRRLAWNTSTVVPFAIGDPDTATTNLVLTTHTDNPTLFPPGSLVVAQTSPNDRQLTLTPAVGQAGVARVTVSVTDGTFTAAQTFVVAVDALTAGAPTNITLPIDVLDNLKENLPSGTVVNPAPLTPLLASDPTPGDTHVFQMLSDADGRFDIVDGNRLRVARGGSALNVEKAQFHSVLIRAIDTVTNHYSRVFSLPLLNANDAPSFRYFPAPWFNEMNVSAPVPTLVVTDEDAGLIYPVRLTLAASGGTLTLNTALLQGPEVTVTGDGTPTVVVQALMGRITTLLSTVSGVTFHPFPDFAGECAVTLTVNDQNRADTTAIGEFPNYVEQEATLTIPGFVLPSPFASWSHDEHGNDLFDPLLQDTVWGGATDKDGDSFGNLLEYGLGYLNSEFNDGNPLTPEVEAGLPSLPAGGGPFVLTGGAPGGPTYNVISFVVREDPRLTAWVEAANRLTPLPDWSADVTQIALVHRQSLGNGFERLVFRDPDPLRAYRVYRLGMSYSAVGVGQ
jgi:hypothetical protein